MSALLVAECLYRIEARIERLTAENEALRKDAERYRWISSRGGSWETEAFLSGLSADEYTAAVDKEMRWRE